MKWKPTPITKMYEALGVIGDKRIEVSGNEAKVYSSSRGKYYDIKYDPEKNAITTNDNASYWVGYMGYPAVAFLLAKGIVKYKKESAVALSGIHWKDLNTKFKNDFEKAVEYILSDLEKQGVNVEDLQIDVKSIHDQVLSLKLEKLGTTAKPPSGY